MDYIYSIILGIIQGLTEFWPVSSSGHLVIAHEILNFSFINDLSFDVALHLGTLAALLVFFRHDIVRFILAFFRSFANWNLKGDINQRLAWFILVGSIPAAVVGYFIADLAETLFRSVWLVALLLFSIGWLFIIWEKISKKDKGLDGIRWRDAIIIGLAQVIALVPGVSRSGITILAGLNQGLTREAAARYSFLLSIPVVFGAGIKKMIDIINIGLSANDWLVMAVGFVSAGIVGYFAINFLLKFLARHSLKAFGIYRIVLAIVIVIIFSLK